MILSVVEPTTTTIVRELRGPDFDNGFLEVVRSFCPCNLSRDAAGSILRERIRRGIQTFVAEHNKRIVGTASLLVDHKFINSGGKVAIVEDVIVHPAFQKLGIGTSLMATLHDAAVKAGCYKICLYCSDDLISYYERLGFYQSDLFLRKDLDLVV